MDSRERVPVGVATLAAVGVAWVNEVASDPASSRKARVLWNAAKGDGWG